MRRKTGGKGGRRNKRGRKEKENEEGEEIVTFVSGSLGVRISSNPRLPCQVSIMHHVMWENTGSHSSRWLCQ